MDAVSGEIRMRAWTRAGSRRFAARIVSEVFWTKSVPGTILGMVVITTFNAASNRQMESSSALIASRI